MFRWQAEDDAILRAISDRDLAAVVAFVVASGSAAPEVCWDPAPEDIDDAKLAAAVDYWRALKSGDPLPRYGAFEPEALKPLLGFLMVIERVAGEDDLAYRLYGSFVASRYGGDRTGERLSKRNAGMGQFFNAAYRAALARPGVLYTTHAPPALSRVKACQRLILPFRREGPAAEVLVVVNCPYLPEHREPFAPLQRRRFV